MHIYHTLSAFPLFSQTLPLFLTACVFVWELWTCIRFCKTISTLFHWQFNRKLTVYVVQLVFTCYGWCHCCCFWIPDLKRGKKLLFIFKRSYSIFSPPYRLPFFAVVWLRPKWVIRGKPNELKMRININVHKRFSCII